MHVLYTASSDLLPHTLIKLEILIRHRTNQFSLERGSPRYSISVTEL